MPKEGSRVQFQNYQNRLPVPFVVYADFEASQVKLTLALHQDTSLILKHIKSMKLVVLVTK